MRKYLVHSIAVGLLYLLANTPLWADSNSSIDRGAQLQGNFTQGGLLFGNTAPGSTVLIDEQNVRVSDSGNFLIGFGRDAKLNWQLVVEHPDGSAYTSTIEISPRSYQIQRIDGIPPSKVTPSEEDYERIAKDSALVRKAREIDDPRLDFLDEFVWPVHGIITGVYGSQRILNGEPRRTSFRHRHSRTNWNPRPRTGRWCSNCCTSGHVLFWRYYDH